MGPTEQTGVGVFSDINPTINYYTNWLKINLC